MSTPHLLWLTLVAANFTIQMLCFSHGESRPLHWAKKVSTPLLLFGGFVIVWGVAGAGFSVAAILLLAMGVGELGIEGSSVVSSEDATPSVLDRWAVTIAGLIFLGVNFYLGAVLLLRAEAGLEVAVGFAVGLVVVGAMLVGTLRAFAPDASVRTQMLLYAPGLVVLAAGAIAALFSPVSHLGVAALILTVSDSLVLVRMGAGLDASVARERTALWVLLVSILLLYYGYMAVLIDSASPFVG